MSTDQTGGLVRSDPAALSNEERILLAALECFVEKGYHGTTIRQIAMRAGLSVPGLYHHFPSKMALLERLIDDTMDDLLEQTEAALTQAGADPVERFTAVIAAHVRYHCERPEESFVGNSELRSLETGPRRRIIEKRDRQQRLFERVVIEGLEAGAFQVAPAHDTARAIVTMCTAVASWYRRDGPLSSDEIVRIYRDLALQTVGYTGEALGA